MTKIFVTGITGFIGSEIAKKLVLNKNNEVFGLVRHCSHKKLGIIEDVLDKIVLKISNLTDYVAIRKILEDISPDYILHLGAYTPVRFSFEQPIEYQQVNYMATINLVHEALKIKNLKKFVFASTMETYGWQPIKKPFTEDLPLNPASPYAVSKAAAEKYIQMAGTAYGLPYIVAKPCNTYGRKHNTGFVTEYIITTMLQGNTVYLGTPDAVRDMMYVDDHVNAYLKTIESDVTGETINFGCGLKLTMEDLAFKIKELIDYDGEIIHGFPPGYPTRPVVEKYACLDNTKAEKLLNWKPKISLEEGLKKTIEYWKQKITTKISKNQ